MSRIAASLSLVSLMLVALPGCDQQDGVEVNRLNVVTELDTMLGTSCELRMESQSCGESGLRTCDNMGDAELEWGPCVENAACVPGEKEFLYYDEICGDMFLRCNSYGGVPELVYDECNTPLVLNFSNEAVAMVSYDEHPETFAVSSPNSCITTDWPTAATPWLAIDLDQNGEIDSGAELFGSGSVLETGRRARHGFQALAEYDSNQDGVINAKDARFNDIVAWSDHDADRRSSSSELQSLSEVGLHSIELDYRKEIECDERGNCGKERSVFQFDDGRGGLKSGEVVDMYLACH